MNDIQISIIIVNYNVKYFLEQCLTSVSRAIEGINAEIYVVDNNSTDGSVEYLRSRFPQVIFIENVSNQGFSKANNQARELAKGKYFLLHGFLFVKYLAYQNCFHILLFFPNILFCILKQINNIV